MRAAATEVEALPVVRLAPQREERAADQRELGDPVATMLLFVPLFANTFLAKWAVPVGPRDLPMAVPLVLLAALAAVATGRARLDQRATVAFLAMAGLLGSIQVWRGEPFSQSSYLLMLVIYAGYVLWIPRDGRGVADALAVFSRVATVIAACGVAQFALQFALDRALVFPIENLVPDSLVVHGYNPQIPLSYGAKVYKSNGVFMLEPSFFSQLCAIAILVELALYNRLSRLCLFALALVLSYSGTGMLVLAVGLPVLVLTQRRWDLAGLALAGAAVGVLLAEALNLEIFAQRAQEFSDPRSSAFERFVGAFYVFDEFLWTDGFRALFGYGAGTYQSYAARSSAPSAELGPWKILFEFGIVGALMNLGFLIWAVMRSSAPLPVRLGVTASFFVNGLYTPTSHGLALSLLVWPADPRTATPVAPKRRSLFAGFRRNRGE